MNVLKMYVLRLVSYASTMKYEYHSTKIKEMQHQGTA